MAGGEPSSEQHGGRLLLPQRAVRSAGGSGGASSGGSGAGHRGHLPQPGGTDSGNELQIRSVSLVYGVQSVRHETARPGGQAAAGADTGSLAGDRGAADLCSVQDPDGRKHHPADAGGRGLDDFRANIMNDTRMRVLYDYASSDYCFPGVDISGGICYFLWDKDYDGPCTVTNAESQIAHSVKRYLNEFPILVRSNAAISIIDKVARRKEQTLDTFVSSQKPFGLRTFARPDENGDLTLRWNGGKGPISSDKVTGGTELIDKWKVIVSRVLYEHGGKADKNGQSRILSILEMLGPKEVCSETYIVVNSYDTEAEAAGLYSYLKTKFARFFIMQATSSIMITRGCFMFVPVQNFAEEWTDEKLYKKYELTEDEIAFIESTVRVME